MALISLVYVSLASQDFDLEQLEELLRESQENNRKLNITGMLLYRDRFFIQALEGEEDVVMPLYEAIAEDERHRNVLLVYKNTITQRSFPDWSMGFNLIGDEEAKTLPGFTDFLQKPGDMTFFVDHPSRAAHLLDSFKNRTYF